MNYMPEVLKMLNIEIDDEFKVANWYGNPYKFDEDYNLIDKDGNYVASSNIVSLIKGCFKIEKLPWKPKEDEWYFYLSVAGGKVSIEGSRWKRWFHDYYCFNAKNCFKTSEEITPEIKSRILSEMKEKYENQ